MKELVFLLEEYSAKALLESLLPRLLNQEIRFRCVPFEGKQDLEKQLTRRIQAYQNRHARFIVLRDQDSHPDCRAVKTKLLDLCRYSGRAPHCLVRIACRELESFFSCRPDGCGAGPSNRRPQQTSGEKKVQSTGFAGESKRRTKETHPTTLRKNQRLASNRLPSGD